MSRRVNLLATNLLVAKSRSLSCKRDALTEAGGKQQSCYTASKQHSPTAVETIGKAHTGDYALEIERLLLVSGGKKLFGGRVGHGEGRRPALK